MDKVAALFMILAVVGLVGYGMYTDATTPENPFEEDPIRVNLTYGENVSHMDYSSEVNQTLAYWMDNDERYGNYSANWTVVSSDADLTIEFVDEINVCGLSVTIFDEFTGCAPILNTTHDVDHDTIRILARANESAVLRTLKHEFGHSHGLNHSDDPQPLMDGEVDYAN